MALCLVLVLGQAFAQENFKISNFYPIESSHSYVGFSVKYMGYAQVRGRFEKFQGTIMYEDGSLKNTSVSFSIDVGSIDTDLDWRDKDLKSDNWFGVEAYPNIQFTSINVNELPNGFEVVGNLTIKDVTKRVALKMDPPSGILKDGRGDTQIIFTGELQIDRTEYNVEGKNWSVVREGITGVDKMVNIEFSILAKRIEEKNYRNWVRNVNNPPGKYYQLVIQQGIDEALSQFEKDKAAEGNKLNPGALNTVGYMLLKEGKHNEALKVFEKNIEAFPENANVFDSYAEALATTSNIEKAITNYQKSLAINPDNQNAKEILRHLQ